MDVHSCMATSVMSDACPFTYVAMGADAAQISFVAAVQSVVVWDVHTQQQLTAIVSHTPSVFRVYLSVQAARASCLHRRTAQFVSGISPVDKKSANRSTTTMNWFVCSLTATARTFCRMTNEYTDCYCMLGAVNALWTLHTPNWYPHFIASALPLLGFS